MLCPSFEQHSCETTKHNKIEIIKQAKDEVNPKS